MLTMFCRPLLLTEDINSYAELDFGESKTFEILLEYFEADDVICVAVDNIPEYNYIENSFEEVYQNDLLSKSTNLQSVPNLSIWLAPTPLVSMYDISNIDSKRRFEPKLFRNEYTFTLTCSHGFGPGKYSLFAQNIAGDGSTQAVRVRYKIHKVVRAKSVKEGEKITDVVGADEVSHFRFIVNEPNKLISITVKPVCDGPGNCNFKRRAMTHK